MNKIQFFSARSSVSSLLTQDELTVKQVAINNTPISNTNSESSLIRSSTSLIPNMQIETIASRRSLLFKSKKTKHKSQQIVRTLKDESTSTSSTTLTNQTATTISSNKTNTEDKDLRKTGKRKTKEKHIQNTPPLKKSPVDISSNNKQNTLIKSKIKSAELAKKKKLSPDKKDLKQIDKARKRIEKAMCTVPSCNIAIIRAARTCTIKLPCNIKNKIIASLESTKLSRKNRAIHILLNYVNDLPKTTRQLRELCILTVKLIKNYNDRRSHNVKKARKDIQKDLTYVETITKFLSTHAYTYEKPIDLLVILKNISKVHPGLLEWMTIAPLINRATALKTIQNIIIKTQNIVLPEMHVDNPSFDAKNKEDKVYGAIISAAYNHLFMPASASNYKQLIRIPPAIKQHIGQSIFLFTWPIKELAIRIAACYLEYFEENINNKMSSMIVYIHNYRRHLLDFHKKSILHISK